MTKPQIIEQDGKPAFVVIPYADWQKIVERLEDEEDVRLYDQAKATGGRSFPAGVVNAILDGENPVRVLREFHGQSLEQLAEAAGVPPLTLSLIETGRTQGEPDVLRRLAAALAVDPDVLAARPDCDEND